MRHLKKQAREGSTAARGKRSISPERIIARTIILFGFSLVKTLLSWPLFILKKWGS
ncbi:hypothetical protein [Virgibacillus ndiopensis]|uniref:hypothetical protein n=1 Tax=Virgibacillus ndiopensis TaxID=2004408 RepID=UPI00159B9173|nr:hypothetical protein [Virgibacillus ndiopensis]